MRQYRSFRLVLLLSIPISYLVTAFLPSSRTPHFITPTTYARGSPSRSSAAGPLWSIANPPATKQSHPRVKGSWIVEERGFVAPQQQVGSNSSIYGGGAYLSRQQAPVRTTVASVLESELDGMAGVDVEQQLPWLLKKVRRMKLRRCSGGFMRLILEHGVVVHGGRTLHL